MKIISVIENSSQGNDFAFEHGLCVYVETRKHKLLLDTGASSLFIDNAYRLGIDLRDIDIVVLSHGHYDHAGGILEFSKINSKAKIYMQEDAINDYYHGDKYIGIDHRIKDLSQVRFIDGDYCIDDELFLFSDVKERLFWPKSNLELSCKVNNELIQDDFSHEQYLVITCDNKSILLSGCAHNGILNILNRYYDIYHGYPDVVISGFHMKKKTDYSNEEIEIIKVTAHKLHELPTIFYTGHCTGDTAFDIMYQIMGNQLKHLYSGGEVYVDMS